MKQNLATNLIGRTVKVDFNTWKIDGVVDPIFVPEHLKSFFEKYKDTKAEICTIFYDKDGDLQCQLIMCDGAVATMYLSFFSVIPTGLGTAV